MVNFLEGMVAKTFGQVFYMTNGDLIEWAECKDGRKHFWVNRVEVFETVYNRYLNPMGPVLS